MSSSEPERDLNESWIADRDKPYGTLISYAGTYLDPDVYYQGIEQLKVQVSKPVDEQSIDTKTFVQELRTALLTHGKDLPEDALFKETWHHEDSDLEFLRMLWRELFPETPVPGEDD